MRRKCVVGTQRGKKIQLQAPGSHRNNLGITKGNKTNLKSKQTETIGGNRSGRLEQEEDE